VNTEPSAPDTIYTEKWYRQEYDDGLQRPAVLLASIALVEVLRPRVVLDVGCGPGVMVAALRALGVRAFGCDASVHAMTMAGRMGLGLVWRHDIRRGGIPASVRFMVLEDVDTVVCTEVAEHLEARYADALVYQLGKVASERIVFTAAPPGQGGLDHVNEQPREYWLHKFEHAGWILDPLVTGLLAQKWAPITRLSHLSKNLTVFTRKGF
jgi:SAM-dependent methyltransferase